MGSFNMACNATNVPITYGDAVVAYKVLPFTVNSGRGEIGDCLRSTHYVASFAVYGKYDDCGEIEVTTEQAAALGTTMFGGNDSTYMYFHRDVWESMRESYWRYCAWDEDYWRSSRDGEPPKYIRNHEEKKEKILSLYERTANGEEITRELEWELQMALYEKELMFYADEGERQHTHLWWEAFEQTKKPRLFVKKYDAEVAWLAWAKHVLNIRIRPSPYAGQEVDSGAFRALATLTMKRLDEYDREYGE